MATPTPTPTTTTPATAPAQTTATTKTTIALAGNPNAGKTTLFNALTGSSQRVGNWPGVTVEKKSGTLKNNNDVAVVDLPGIYSLSPYTLEEVVARDFLLSDSPDVILNIVDGTNLERNLYLTTQLYELGIPMVVVVNMVDLVRKNGEEINVDVLAKELGCPVHEISALKNEGIDDAIQTALEIAGKPIAARPTHWFSAPVEHCLAHIEEAVIHEMTTERQRWHAVKLFERDQKVIEQLGVSDVQLAHIDGDIRECEQELGDESDAIITAQRYDFIESLVKDCYKKKREAGKLTISEKIDRVVTNRVLALPIFVLIMFLVYYLAVTTVGSVATDWANDGVFGDGWFLSYEEPAEYTDAVDAFDEAQLIIEAHDAGETEYLAFDDETGTEEAIPFTKADYKDALEVEEPDPHDFGIWIPGVPVLVEDLLSALNVEEGGWLWSLIIDGIVKGVGAVLGFVPQLMMLFFLLAILELCGYMSRVAFILDRLFRRFGLSGKSFIPLLIATGCGVPGIMAARTIEDMANRRMTIMTTTFMPCGAKLPVIALFAGAIFGGEWWVAPSCYFLGIGMVLISGIILKKTHPFAGTVTPFIMELPPYHVPMPGSVLRIMGERTWAFVRKAFTIVLGAIVIIWFLSTYGFEGGVWCAVEDASYSILAALGSALAFLFIPLGWADWHAVAGTITGFLAKEELVATFGVLYGAGDAGNWYTNFAAAFTPAAAYSLLAFNLLCMPCFAAVTTIAREMNSRKWLFAAIGYEFLVAYLVAMWIYQFAGLATGVVEPGVWTLVAGATLIGALFMLFRPNPYKVAKVSKAPLTEAVIVEGADCDYASCASCPTASSCKQK